MSRQSADVAQHRAGWPDLPSPHNSFAEKPEGHLRWGAAGEVVCQPGAGGASWVLSSAAEKRWHFGVAILYLRNGATPPPAEEHVVLHLWKGG